MRWTYRESCARPADRGSMRSRCRGKRAVGPLAGRIACDANAEVEVGTLVLAAAVVRMRAPSPPMTGRLVAALGDLGGERRHPLHGSPAAEECRGPPAPNP